MCSCNCKQRDSNASEPLLLTICERYRLGFVHNQLILLEFQNEIIELGVLNAGARDERFGGERQNRGTAQLVEKGTIALASEHHCICFSARLGANPLLVAGKIGEKVQCFGVTIRAIITQAHSSGISRTIQIDETKTSFVSGK